MLIAMKKLQKIKLIAHTTTNYANNLTARSDWSGPE
jgi:hypothetical protein